MKIQIPLLNGIAPTVLALAVAIWFGAQSLPAQTVMVESKFGTATTDVTPCPPYCETAGGWSYSSAKSSAPGVTSGIGSRYGYNGTPSVTITPTLKPSTMYRMEITHISPNSSPDITVNISYTGCTGTTNSTTAFRTARANFWEEVGNITVDVGVTQPSVTFTYASGTLASTGGRWYMDSVRFVDLSDPCVNGFEQLATVNGPLAAGQTYVDVPAVSNAATAVKIYANGIPIGTNSSGITGGVVRVTTSPLVKDQTITATQVNPAGVESCRPNAGPTVGGGANPRIRISLNIRQDAALTGPIGATATTSSSRLKFLGASNTFNSQYAWAPVGGRVIQPDGCWQTVSFLRGPEGNQVDPSYAWSVSDGSNNIAGNFGIFDGIAFAIDDLSNSGPFRIYLDNFMNGSVLLQDFEAATNGQRNAMFYQPGYASTPQPTLIGIGPNYAPNLTAVTNEQADTGSQSLFVNWQFNSTNGGNWVRLVTTNNLMVDLRQPISFRILLLPAGTTNIPLKISSQPNGVAVMQGNPVVLQVSACGTPPLSYQWFLNNNPVPGATNNTYAITNVQASQSGAYYVVVSNATGSLTSSNALVTVEYVKYPGQLVQQWALNPADRGYLTPDGQHGGLAYNPITHNLVLVTRTGGDSIKTINSATGADGSVVDWDSIVVVGGLYRMHKIGINSEGKIFVANVTLDASLDEFRIYRWLDEYSLATLAWHGNPGGASDANRWGDTFDVRDFSSGGQVEAQILVGSYGGNKVAVIAPATNATACFTFTVSNAPPGAFAHGICWGDGDTFWGKSYNGSLYHVGLNFTTQVATVLHVYNNVPTLAAIKWNSATKLLGGVSIATPDTLRIYDLSNLTNGPVLLDHASFPTDNANTNFVGAVTFSPRQVYALNANNGIVSLRIRPWINASGGKQLQIQWPSGVLESATEVNGTYSAVPGATSPYSVNTAVGTRKFYRISE